MSKLFWLVGLLWFCGSCEITDELKTRVDRAAFSWVGSTVFRVANQLTMKEIHLERSALLGEQVSVKGEVVEVGDHSTFLVASDKTARLLVVLTDLESDGLCCVAERKGRTVSILGVVDYGQKGLPYLLAKSVVWHDSKAS